jgi:hypothetical protein
MCIQARKVRSFAKNTLQGGRGAVTTPRSAPGARTTLKDFAVEIRGRSNPNEATPRPPSLIRNFEKSATEISGRQTRLIKARLIARTLVADI